jgi:hypothetical protein
MHVDSKSKLARRDPKREPRYEILEVPNLHRLVLAYETKLPLRCFPNRTFLQSLAWRKICDIPPTFIWVNVHIDRHDRFRPEEEANAVRAIGMRYLRLTQVSEDVTHMDYGCSLDLKGTLPRWVADRKVPELMCLPYYIQLYFLQVRRPSECTADDGKCIGHMVTDTAEAAKKHDRVSAIRTFVMRMAVLRECQLAAVDAMFVGIFARKALASAPSTSTLNDPAALAAPDAENIGRSLTSIVLRGAAASAAVGELVRLHPVLGVTEQHHAWFRPMLETIARRQGPDPAKSKFF